MRILVFLLLLFLGVSCMSTKYTSSKNANDFSQITLGETYLIVQPNDQKIKMTVSSIDDENIVGTVNDQSMTIPKNSVVKMKKNSPVATGFLIGGVVVGTVLTVVILKAINDITLNVFNPR